MVGMVICVIRVSMLNRNEHKQWAQLLKLEIHQFVLVCTRFFYTRLFANCQHIYHAPWGNNQPLRYSALYDCKESIYILNFMREIVRKNMPSESEKREKISADWLHTYISMEELCKFDKKLPYFE